MSVLITIDEAKDHLRLKGAASSATLDAVLQDLIDSAEDYVANMAGCALKCEEQVEHVHGGSRLLLYKRKPVVSVSEVYDLSEQSVVDPDHYAVEDQYVVRVLTRYTMYPSIYNDRWHGGKYRYRVTYLGGYNNGNASDAKPEGSSAAPRALSSAVIMLINKMYRAGGMSQNNVNNSTRVWESLVSGDVAALIESVSMRQVV